MSMAEQDSLTRFVFEHAPVRGAIVHLQQTWREVLGRHDYPAPVQRILGELMAAGALLASGIKFDGKLILQMQGDGPLKLAVVEVTSRHTLRATARWEEGSLHGPLPNLLGEGQFVMTIDQSGASQQNYQGIVPLEGGTVAQVLEHYLVQSEQLDTRLMLAVDETTAAGMLLQKLPEGSGQDTEAWERAQFLAATLTPAELLKLPARDLLLRLFHEETLRRFQQQPLSFHCGCSRARTDAMLRALGREEVEETLAEQGQVEVVCEFCKARYVYDAVDTALLFSALAVGGPAPGQLH